MTIGTEEKVSATSTKVSAKLPKKNIYKTVKDSHGYLQLQYYDPVSKKDMPFPQGTTINIIYVNDKGSETEHSKNPLKINNSDGKVSFPIEQKKHMYFEISFKETTYLNITKKSLVSYDELAKLIRKDKLYLTKEMLFMLPEKISLKKSWWDIGEHPESDEPYYDKKSRLFLDLKTNKLKGKSGHLKVTLKPEWQYVSFRYYDRHKKSEQVVPQYIMLEGYNEDIDDDTPMTKSNLFKDNCICLPWIQDNSKSKYRNAGDIILKFETSDAFVKSEATPKIENDTIENIRKKPLTKRFKYYDLPQKWVSSNWIVKVGADEDLFEKMVNTTTETSAPLAFDLDSVVLTDDDLDCESWDEDDRFTVFDIKVEITNPDTNKPYWSKDKLKSNFFTKKIIDKFPRIIARNDKFYDITDKRSKDGDVIGARAAVLNDEAVHYGDDLTKPVCSSGNFDLHYFADCLDSSNDPISALMIYWSCEFEKGSKANDSDVINFQKIGMKGSKDCWESKEYLFKAKDSSAKIAKVKPVFFFEGREDSPYKCSVELQDPKSGRAYMGISSAGFKTDNYQPHPFDLGSTDTDGKKYKRHTMAHELGHGVGLNDEYLESLEEDNQENNKNFPHELWNPPLPQFGQYYPGMPYSCDHISMMVSNRAPRLRYFWYFCRWLNETENVKKLTSNAVYQVNYSGSKTFNYYLQDNKNFYKPVYEEKNVKNGKHGIFDLFLYKVGNDETTEMMIPSKGDFDSILIVYSKLQWFFDDFDGNKWKEINYKLRYLRYFQKSINNDLNQKFYLECNLDSDFKKVYVYFVPHYYFEGWKSSDHFEITVKANPGPSIKYKPDFNKDSFDDDDFSVDAKQNHISIMRYVLGLVPYKKKKKTIDGKEYTWKESIKHINKDELNFLAKWTAEKRNQGYSYNIMS